MIETALRYKQVRLDASLQEKINAKAKEAKKRRGDYIVSLIVDPDNYAGVNFGVKYITEPISRAIVLEFDADDRKKFAEIADTVRAINAYKKERKITDEMIIRQLLEAIV